jgi:SAM-dependent methyltransferase
MPDIDKTLPSHWFNRQDNSADHYFYAQPRLVQHIDLTTIDQLTEFYRHFLQEGSDLLDCMSSWVSHLPEEMQFRRVTGLGMNAEELRSNPRLTDWCVHDLNLDPTCPLGPDRFDYAMITVSIQYLIKPIAVLESLRMSLKPGGQIAIAMSHRCFPTKAIAAFQVLPANERIQLVKSYLEQAGFSSSQYRDCSPQHGDPLWIVTGKV